MNWYVIYTKSRYEKAVAEKLESCGIQVFCPLLKVKKKWSDRWKWVEEPLFKSYCFVYLSDSNRDQVFGIPGVVRYLYYCGKAAIVRDKEIDLLRNWLNEYSHESFENVSYKPKDKVVVRSGALIDQAAEVINSTGNYIILKLESLGVQIKVDLRKNIVEKLAEC